MVLSFIRSQLIIFSKQIESSSFGTKNLRQKECYKNVTIWEAFFTQSHSSLRLCNRMWCWFYENNFLPSWNASAYYTVRRKAIKRIFFFKPVSKKNLVAKTRTWARADASSAMYHRTMEPSACPDKNPVPFWLTANETTYESVAYNVLPWNVSSVHVSAFKYFFVKYVYWSSHSKNNIF